MDLTREQLQYLLNDVNTHIKVNGVVVAGMGAVLAKTLQNEFSKLPAEHEDPGA